MSSKLTADEQVVCNALGITEDTFRLGQDQGGRRAREWPDVALSPSQRAFCNAHDIRPETFLKGLEGEDSDFLTPGESAVCRALGIRPGTFLLGKQ